MRWLLRLLGFHDENPRVVATQFTRMLDKDFELMVSPYPPPNFYMDPFVHGYFHGQITVLLQWSRPAVRDRAFIGTVAMTTLSDLLGGTPAQMGDTVLRMIGANDPNFAAGTRAGLMVAGIRMRMIDSNGPDPALVSARAGALEVWGNTLPENVAQSLMHELVMCRLFAFKVPMVRTRKD